MSTPTKILLLVLLVLGITASLPQAHAALSSGLVSYWDADGTTDFSNRVTSGDNLTTVGSPVISTGYVGEGYNMTNSASDYEIATNANNVPSGNSDRTTCMWINERVDQGGHNSFYFTIGDTASNGGWGIYYSPTGTPTLFGVAGDVPFTHTAAQGNYSYICATWDGTHAFLYFNGQLDTTVSGATVATTTSTVTFGQLPGVFSPCCTADGVLDEVGIWNRNLTASEISDLFTLYKGGGNFNNISGNVSPPSSHLIVRLFDQANNSNELKSYCVTTNFSRDIYTGAQCTSTGSINIQIDPGTWSVNVTNNSSRYNVNSTVVIPGSTTVSQNYSTRTFLSVQVDPYTSENVRYQNEAGTNYTKYTGNPLTINNLTSFGPFGHNFRSGELTLWVENDTIKLIMGIVSDDTTNFIQLYGETKNPYNLSVQRQIHDLDGLRFEQLVHTLGGSVNISGQYHMVIGSSPRHLVSNNAVNWANYCGPTINTSMTSNGGAVSGVNPSMTFDPARQVWTLLTETGLTSTVYTSTDGCDFSNGTTLNGINPYTMMFNGTALAYFSQNNNSMPTFYTDVWFKNTTFDTLTQHTANSFVGAPSQGWETSVGITDEKILIIPDSSRQYFDKNWYLYYTADQNQTGVATDTLNRTFYAVHGVSDESPQNFLNASTSQFRVMGATNNDTVSKYHFSIDGNIIVGSPDLNTNSYSAGYHTLQLQISEVVSGTNYTVISSPYQFFIEQNGNAPVLVTTSISATLDNLTLVLNANATDNNSDPVRYYYKAYRNGNLYSSGVSGFFTQGVDTNFLNITTGGMTGSYFVNVTANDGTFNSTTLMSNTLSVSFAPIPGPSGGGGLSPILSAMFLLIGLLIELFGLLFQDEKAKYYIHLAFIAALILAALALVL